MNLTAIRGNLVSMRGNLLAMDARKPLIIEIDTTLGNGFNTFTLPLTAHTTDIVVKVSDGQQFNISNYLDIDRTVNFATSGVYTIELRGQCGWSFNNTGDCQKVTWVKSWGNFYFNYLVGGFYGCINIGSNGGLPMTGSINAPNATSLMDAFRNTKIKTFNSELLYKCSNLLVLQSTFRDNLLETIPVAPFVNNPKVTNCQTMFYGSNIKAGLPNYLFYPLKNCTSYRQVFGASLNITPMQLPLVLFDLSVIFKVTTFYSAFASNNILGKMVGVIQPIWDYASPTAVKTDCLLNQTDIDNYDDIPNEWKGL